MKIKSNKPVTKLSDDIVYTLTNLSNFQINHCLGNLIKIKKTIKEAREVSKRPELAEVLDKVAHDRNKLSYLETIMSREDYFWVNFNLGLCSNVRYYYVIKDLFEFWPHYSGNKSHPVPASLVKSEAKKTNRHTANLYDTAEDKYGALKQTKYSNARMALLNWLINTLTNYLAMTNSEEI